MGISDALIRLGMLVLALLPIVVLVWAGRLFVERQRRLALAAAPLAGDLPGQLESKIRILAFSSAACTQCHTLQRPVLRRLQALRKDEIEVVEVDAPGSPKLTNRYRILTVPSTVLINPAGEAFAVNYGFADLSTLQQQIDASLVSAR
jgi:hypothetical protein